MVRPEEREQIEAFREQGFHVEPDVYDRSGNTMVVEFPTKDSLLDQVEALGYDSRVAAELVESADEISLNDMLAFQAMYQQEYADNAVSYTVNVPPGLNQNDLADALALWLPKLKGTTVMVDGSRPQAPYERINRGRYLLANAVLVADGVDEDCASGACPVR
jgi:ribonucleoside-triphosphate reductase (thioredoxin)